MRRHGHSHDLPAARATHRALLQRSRREHERTAPPERGFTLLELVLCLAILGASFLSVLTLQTSAIDKAGRFNLERTCQRLAQEKLDEIVYGLETETAGDFEEEPTWSWEVEIFSLADSDTLYPLLQASITVSYSIDENEDPSEYLLDTRFFADVEHPLHEYANTDEEQL